MFPIHIWSGPHSAHWVMVQVEPRNRSIRIIDSCYKTYGEQHAKIFKMVEQWALHVDLVESVKRESVESTVTVDMRAQLAQSTSRGVGPVQARAWSTTVWKEAPQQTYANCGVYFCMFAKAFALGGGIHSIQRAQFRDSDMDARRLMMLHELLTHTIRN